MVESVERGAQVAVPEHVRAVDDDLRHVVVMNADSGEIFGLDNSAAVIWQELATSGSIDSAADVLVSTYGVDRAVASADVEAFAATLVTRNLLVRKGDGHGGSDGRRG